MRPYVIGSRNRAFGPSFRLGEPPWRGKRPTPRASPIPTLHRVIPDLQYLQIIRTRFVFGVDGEVLSHGILALLLARFKEKLDDRPNQTPSGLWRVNSVHCLLSLSPYVSHPLAINFLPEVWNEPVGVDLSDWTAGHMSCSRDDANYQRLSPSIQTL